MSETILTARSFLVIFSAALPENCEVCSCSVEEAVASMSVPVISLMIFFALATSLSST